MRLFSQSLDRYLTTEPDSGFETWCEQVTEHFTEDFYEQNEDWIEKSDGQCNKLMNDHFNKDTAPKLAAKIIEQERKWEQLRGCGLDTILNKW